MGSCCNPRGCDEFFSGKFARRVAQKYRKRGLDKTATRIVEFLEGAGIERASVLEVGGGVGEIQLELLTRGDQREKAQRDQHPDNRRDVATRRVLRRRKFIESSSRPWLRRLMVMPDKVTLTAMGAALPAIRCN
jgi:hypothetical protein